MAGHSPSTHPYHQVAIVGAYNTKQARRLPGETMHSLLVDAVFGACADAGIDIASVDAFVGQNLSLIHISEPTRPY